MGSKLTMMSWSWASVVSSFCETRFKKSSVLRKGRRYMKPAQMVSSCWATIEYPGYFLKKGKGFLKMVTSQSAYRTLNPFSSTCFTSSSFIRILKLNSEDP